MATWYCDLNAAVNGNGQLTTPWNNIASVKAGTSAGDTVNMKGTLTQTGVLYWDSGNSVTLQAWPGSSCTITFSGVGAELLIQSGALRLNGINFTSTLSPRTDGDNEIVIEVAGSYVGNCTIDTYWGTAIYVGAANCTVEGNTVNHGSGGHGIWLHGANAVVRYNNVQNIGGQNDGVFVDELASGADIYGNYIAANSLKSDIIVRGGEMNNHDITGVRIHENFLAGRNAVAGIDNDCSSANGHVITDTWIYNNVFMQTHNPSGNPDDSYGMIRINVPYSTDAAHPWRIYNNTLAMIGDSSSGTMYRSAIPIITTAGDATNYIELRNNIIYILDANTGSGYEVEGLYFIRTSNTGITDDYNVYYDNWGPTHCCQGVSPGAHTLIQSDPLFVNVNSGSPLLSDLSLQSGSPARASGKNEGAYFLTGLVAECTFPNPTLTTRGATWDIGAYIYGSTGVTIPTAFENPYLGTIVSIMLFGGAPTETPDQVYVVG